MHTVTASGLAFDPDPRTVLVGEWVRWVGLAGLHNIAQTNGPADMLWNGSGFYSGPPGAADFTAQFNTPGTFYYVSEPYAAAGMRGVIIVKLPDPTPTPTWTPDAEGEPLVKALPGPNPNPSEIRVQLRRGVERLTLKIFTKALAGVEQSQSGPLGPGWQGLALPPAFLSGASNGLYHYVVVAEEKGRPSRQHSVGNFLILK